MRDTRACLTSVVCTGDSAAELLETMARQAVCGESENREKEKSRMGETGLWVLLPLVVV